MQRAGKEAVLVSDGAVVVHNELGTPSTHRFDVVLRPDATQLDVFEQLKPLLDSALSGYNATVFAYGQTVRVCLCLCGVRFGSSTRNVTQAPCRTTLAPPPPFVGDPAIPLSSPMIVQTSHARIPCADAHSLPRWPGSVVQGTGKTHTMLGVDMWMLANAAEQMVAARTGGGGDEAVAQEAMLEAAFRRRDKWGVIPRSTSWLHRHLATAP